MAADPPSPHAAWQRPDFRALISISALAQLLGVAVTLLAARILSLDAFEAYVVGASLFILMAAAAPLGMEKYSLRRLPPLLQSARNAEAKGLIRLAARRTLLAALLLALGAAAIALCQLPPGEMRSAILFTCLSLPAGALAHLTVELLTAAGRPRTALFLFRLLVPATALLVTAGLARQFGDLPAAAVIGAWGLGWIVALVGMAACLRKQLPAELCSAAPLADAAAWRSGARPFFAHRVAMVLLAQSPILALELFGALPGEVGAYAAAAAVAGLVTLLATATNRAYGPDLAVLIDAADDTSVRQLLADRQRWLWPALAAVLLPMLLAPGAILGIFRPEFVGPGTAPLRILAITMAFTTWHALLPKAVKYRARNGLLFQALLGAAALQTGLLILLVPLAGATGAAIAHLITMAGQYWWFARHQR